ncbi:MULTISPECIES: hypothetical protein [Haloferacaceae]|uniref:Uncharacterized protein n=1 Tax=Halorubrum glutamatedens TaxID=2707018 RepID=A0ABD5QQR1_9EURY|nr:hypothetical protein [Halobellus captivus]
MDPPVVPAERLDGWRHVDDTVDRPFAAGPVSVTASTARYERADRPDPRPFFFASRLRIRPETPPNAALARLVENRARSGFRDRLAERDIGGIEPRGERTIAVDDPDATEATLATFRGRCTLDGEEVPVEAMLAVWEADQYLLAGGAYRLDGGANDARRELLSLVRAVRPE